MCALRRIFQIINVCRDSYRSIIMTTAGANALKNAFAMYEVRSTMYDLLIMCALRKIFRIINVCKDSPRSIIMMTARANALENAFAMYDVRFINNVRVAQDFSDH